jgi:predicted Fe-Mo cluster-binding NifX family protein
MKIAIQTNDKETVGENFGRALYYAVYDTETDETIFLSNEENAGAAHGVGIQAAALMSREGVTVVLSYHVGPKAGDILRQNSIDIFNLPAEKKMLSIREAVDIFLKEQEG